MTNEVDGVIWNLLCSIYDALGSRKSSLSGATVDEDGTHHTEISALNEVFEFAVKRRVDNNDHYWLDYLKDVDGRRAVIDAGHYVIGEENEPGFQGMGGREFNIKFFDSNEVVTTHNLWYQGVVPPAHRGTYPNNAEFVTGGRVTLSDGSHCWNSSVPE